MVKKYIFQIHAFAEGSPSKFELFAGCGLNFLLEQAQSCISEF
jgi:hypothetical protein